MPKTLTIELPDFHHWKCATCGHVEMVSYVPCSFPCKCTKCGADASSMYGPPQEYPRFWYDEKPRAYNLADSRDLDVQVYFYVPGWTGRRGFTCGIEDPAELEGLSTLEALALVKEKIDRYIYNGDKPIIAKLKSFVEDAAPETKAAWEKNERAYRREMAARKVIDLLDDLTPEDQP